MISFCSSIKANTWTHVAVTWNLEQRTACLWVDNEKETFQVSHSVDLPFKSDAQYFHIGPGNENRNLSRYQGYIRDVKLFEKGLSQAEVEDIKGILTFLFLALTKVGLGREILNLAQIT